VQAPRKVARRRLKGSSRDSSGSTPGSKNYTDARKHKRRLSLTRIVVVSAQCKVYQSREWRGIQRADAKGCETSWAWEDIWNMMSDRGDGEIDRVVRVYEAMSMGGERLERRHIFIRHHRPKTS